MQKFKTKFAALALLLLCSVCAPAQVYVFTNQSREQVIGMYSTTRDYTYSWDQVTDTGYNKNRTALEVSWGTEKVSISYPFLNVNNQSIYLGGPVGYGRMTDGKYHTWTVRVGNGLQEVFLDSVLIYSGTRGYVVNNGPLIMSSSSDIDRISCTVKNFVFSASYIKLKSEVAMPDLTYLQRNAPRGYVGGGNFDNVASCLQQLRQAAVVIRKPAPGAPKIHPMFDFFKAGGELDSTIPVDIAIAEGVAIAKIIADSLNGDFRVIGNASDWEAYKDQPTSSHGKFNLAMIALANAHPEYELRVDFSFIHLDAMPGHPTLTPDQCMAMYPNEPLTSFQHYRYILQSLYGSIQSQLRYPIKYAMGDNEGLFNKWLDTAKYQANPACRAAKEATGLSWWDYCSRQYTNAMKYMYDGIRLSCPNITINEYDVHGWDYCNHFYDAKFNYRVELNTNGYGTDQFYPRLPINLLRGGLTSGDHRGVLTHYLPSKQGQIKSGHPFNSPFYGMGYTGIPEVDINCTMAIGVETFITFLGSPTGYPSLYIEGNEKPNSKGYAWQMYSLTIAQAACAPVWDYIMTGELLDGDRNMPWQCYSKPLPLFHTGDYETLAAVRRSKTNPNLYAICTWHGGCTNVRQDGVPLKKTGLGITLMNRYVPLDARQQSSIYVFDISKAIEAGKNPRVVNGWVLVGLVENWPTQGANTTDN